MTYFTFNNLLQAYLQCRKRKTTTKAHIEFFSRLELNLLQLEQELQSKSYRPQSSIAFVVKHPKIREVFAANFRDRVIHHLLISYIEPKFERIFIYDSYACRRGKGTHRAVRRLQNFVWEVNRRLPENQHFYIKMDIKSFFASIDRQILYQLIAKKIKKEEILWLSRQIIFHDCVNDPPPVLHSSKKLFDSLPPGKSLFHSPPGKGLPIGNLTSQFFANVYLNQLDQYIKRVLKIKYYIRYVDDFVIVGHDPAQLRAYQYQIGQFLQQKLQLELHPHKTTLRPISDGIDFLGYIVRPHYLLVRKRVIGNWRRRLETYASTDPQRGEKAHQSYLAHAKQANSYWLMKKQQLFWEKLTPEAKKWRLARQKRQSRKNRSSKKHLKSRQ